MLIDRLRRIVQIFAFFFLTYGGRLGIHLGYSIPCFSCIYVSSCGGYCFLYILQRLSIFGLTLGSAIFTAYWFQQLLAFVFFALWVMLLSKMWCGWLCPFGTLLDGLTTIRKKMGIAEVELPWYVVDTLKLLKYVFLGLIILLPLGVVYLKFPRELNYLFCYICPARPIMPMFEGRFNYFYLDYSSYITLAITTFSMVFLGVSIVGSFFKERFFCMMCPMLPLIELCSKISPLRLEKKSHRCSGCGNCQRVCSMNNRKVHEQDVDGKVDDTDCILCGHCTTACPVDDVLEIKFYKWTLYKSSKKNLLSRLVKKHGKR